MSKSKSKERVRAPAPPPSWHIIGRPLLTRRYRRVVREIDVQTFYFLTTASCLFGTTWDLLVHVIGVRRQVALLPEGDAGAVGALVLAQLQVHRIDMPRQVAAGEAVRAGVRALGQLGLSK